MEKYVRGTCGAHTTAVQITVSVSSQHAAFLWKFPLNIGMFRVFLHCVERGWGDPELIKCNNSKIVIVAQQRTGLKLTCRNMATHNSLNSLELVSVQGSLSLLRGTIVVIELKWSKEEEGC